MIKNKAITIKKDKTKLKKIKIINNTYQEYSLHYHQQYY